MRSDPIRRPSRRQLHALALAVPLALAGCGGEPAAPEGAAGGAEMTPAPAAGPIRLAAGEPVTAGLDQPWPHRYEVEVPGGHYLRLVARQRGIDVALRLLPPDGGAGLEFDSPSGTEGEEVAHAVAVAGGVYLVEVEIGDDPEPGGRYELEVADLRPATAEDRLRTEAESALAVAEGLRRSGQPGRAAAYEAALPLAERLGDERLLAYNLERLGEVEVARRRPLEARRLWQRSLELSARLGDVERRAVLHNRLAVLDRREGRLEEALDHQRQALELFRQAGDPAATAATLAAIGSTLDQLGRPLAALGSLHESLDLWRRLGEPAKSVVARQRLGEVLLSLGSLDESADHFAAAARLARQHGEVVPEAIAERGLGAVRSRRQDAAGAIEHLERALSLARGAGSEALIAVALGDLATVRLQLGQVAEARRSLDEALAISRRLGDRGYQAFMLHKLAQCHHADGEHAESARLHGEAAGMFADLGHQVALAGARYGLARAHRLAGDPRAGLAALEGALVAAEEVRRAVGGRDLQSSYLASKRHYRELHVDLWMDLDAREPGSGHDLAALLADDRGRARALLALLGDATAGDPATAPAELVAERDRLEDGLARLQRLADGPSAGTAADDLGADAVRRRQRELLTRLERVREELRRHAPRREEVAERPLTAAALDEMLDADTVVLVYSLGEERSFLWAVWRGGRESAILPPRSEIDLFAGRVLQEISSPRPSAAAAAERAAAELARRVLEPVAHLLGRHRRIAVVADGGLHLVPFAALPDPSSPGRPLIAEREVVVLPSLSVLDRIRRREPAPGAWRGLAAVMADPVFDLDDPRVAGGPGAPAASPPGRPVVVPPLAEPLTRALADQGLTRFPRLPGTRAEAEALLRLLPADAEVFRGFGFAADRAAVLDGALAGYRIVHLATHGVLDRRTPALSGLVLSLIDEAGRPRDGHLQLHEVFDLDLNAEVIVLSACQSGVGRDMAGEGLSGLTRGFLEAGAPRLLVSLWQVGDRGSAELMERFYRSWLVGGEAPAAALATAQRSMWSESEWSAPYHWAGFQLVGDWTATAPLLGRDDSIEKKDAGTSSDPTPDDPLPGPPGPGKRPPR